MLMWSHNRCLAQPPQAALVHEVEGFERAVKDLPLKWRSPSPLHQHLAMVWKTTRVELGEVEHQWPPPQPPRAADVAESSIAGASSAVPASSAFAAAAAVVAASSAAAAFAAVAFAAVAYTSAGQTWACLRLRRFLEFGSCRARCLSKNSRLLLVLTQRAHCQALSEQNDCLKCSHLAAPFVTLCGEKAGVLAMQVQGGLDGYPIGYTQF